MLGDYQAAKEFTQNSLKIFKNHLEEDNVKQVAILLIHANILRKLGEYERSEYFCKKALEINKNQFGENHLKYAYNLGSLAEV